MKELGGPQRLKSDDAMRCRYAISRANQTGRRSSTWLMPIAILACVASCQVDSEVGSNALIATDATVPIDAVPRPACRDGKDNDGDGRIDYPAEPGCDDPNDPDETDPDELPACSNGADDDGDDIADYPLEPGCEAASDDDEADPATPPQCADTLDNDDNGTIDYPDDIGCHAAGDPEESSVTS